MYTQYYYQVLQTKQVTTMPIELNCEMLYIRILRK